MEPPYFGTPYLSHQLAEPGCVAVVAVVVCAGFEVVVACDEVEVWVDVVLVQAARSEIVTSTMIRNPKYSFLILPSFTYYRRLKAVDHHQMR